MKVSENAKKSKRDYSVDVTWMTLSCLARYEPTKFLSRLSITGLQAPLNAKTHISASRLKRPLQLQMLTSTSLKTTAVRPGYGCSVVVRISKCEQHDSS
jgi:hypothetical protein